MKALVLSLALLTVSAVQASVVLETPTIPMSTRTEARFQINRAKETAWIQLRQTVHHTRGHGESYDEVHETVANVEGLSFDETTNTIVLVKDGALVECATVQLRGISIFRYNKITPTNCKLTTKRVKRENSRFTNTQVHLITK